MKLKLVPKLWLLFVFVLLAKISTAQTVLPYFQSFKETTAPNIEFGGNPAALLTAAQGIDPPSQGYLRLTNNNTNQTGFIYSKENFNTSQGLSISFEYYTYGGSGADGICFFLFDATASSNFNIGGFGGSLGYAQYRPYNSNTVLPGVSKGYLGVALDEFGNFPNPIEGRDGGITGPGLFGISTKSVVLRGKGNGNATTNNYKYLTSVTASAKGVDLVNDANERFPDSTQLGFRKAFIDLQPNPAGGYNVSVRIQVGGSPTKTTTVIDNYYYADAAPANLAYGISSSTGDLTNFHEIRNVAIDIYRRPFTSPIALNDNLSECLSKISTVNVVSNDASTNVNGTIVNSSIDLDPVLTGEQKSFIVSGKGVFTANSNGTITFTPSGPNVTGPVAVRYTITDSFGFVSSPATLTITDPVTTVPSNAGTDQLINISTALGATTLNGNSPASSSGQWVQASGPSNSIFANSTSASTNVTNLTLGTYVFNWNLTVTGQCLSTDAVNVIVNAIPVAVNDVVIGRVNTPSIINVINNDTDRDGNATIDRSTVIIKTIPANGTLAIDPVTGNVTYTPNTGYVGPDSFTYTIKDVRGAESNAALVNITVPVPPKIGLAKSLVSTVEQLDESFNVTFLFTVKNYGNVMLQNLSLKDDLVTTFNATPYTIVSLTSVGNTLTVNPSYNGNPNTEMLAINNQIQGGATEQVELVLNVKLNRGVFTFSNTAFVEGVSSIDGTVTRDQSTDGLTPDPTTPGDVTPNVPTPIKFIIDKLFIPEGFSPNGDGNHDLFVIPNGGLTPLNLEIYNRWGNVVYKSTDYVNNWDGRSNKGLYVGQDLPVGTYYYIVNYNAQKYVGYITLNR
ncbi:gliding motility-associated C-terminal domain-containing protein [Pedobacter alpinus]|uniref:Gliding motility-associated C-terminal domain-containing protein n=1 Tax=Pedobacter alpinus TaxID=1590643 RepID=A0ABW5TRM9_9SPHI